MVRCRSLVEQGRIIIVDVMTRRRNGEAGVQEEEETNDDEEEEESGPDGPGQPGRGAWNAEEEDLYMDVARVYEHTLVKLGDTLGEPEVGVLQMMSAD